MNSVRILDCDFSVATMQDVLDWCVKTVARRDRSFLSTVNVNILMSMRSSAPLRQFVESSGLVVADGQPIVWASRLLGTPLPERVAGVDVLQELAGRAEQQGLGIYLLGGTRDVVAQAAERLRARFPRLRLCGAADGYFSDEQAGERASTIARSGADILFVGMGSPKQELFIASHWSRLGVSLAMGVGGSFEVVAGMRSRAPRLLQRLGLEWVIRLAQEPRRLWKRYLVTNAQFVWLLARELVRRRLPGADARTFKR
jgi:N-acetylglucosaminyldiphosphoundecaprenol N-acetyl-beta-D-mannosaminyltransferase